jgi:hypothetical protein
MYTPDSLVSVQPFTQQADGEEVIIGRVDTGVFLAVPAEAVELLDELARGRTVGEVSDSYLRKYGETPDLEDFLQILEAKGIVKPLVPGEDVDEAAADAATPRQGPRVRYHFSNFPQRLARLIFSPPAFAFFFVIIALAAATAIRNPSLLPRTRDLYFTDRRTITLTLLILSSYATIFIHEFGHLVAARAVGINSRMGISHRLWYLVAETDLTGLWSVPKRQRYLPMLAGTMVDLLSGSLLLLLIFAREQGWVALPLLALRVARGMMFTHMMRIFWQFFLFVRTDFYYVIASLFNCRNLLKDTEGFLRNLLARVLPFIRTVDQSSIPESERRVIRFFSILWVAGHVLAVVILFTVTLPLAGMYIRNIGLTFRRGYSTSPSDFADALLLSAYTLIPLSVGLVLWLRGLARPART